MEIIINMFCKTVEVKFWAPYRPKGDMVPTLATGRIVTTLMFIPAGRRSLRIAFVHCLSCMLKCFSLFYWLMLINCSVIVVFNFVIG